MLQHKGEGRRWVRLAAVFTVALAVRSLYLCQIHDAPFFELRSAQRRSVLGRLPGILAGEIGARLTGGIRIPRERPKRSSIWPKENNRET